jgi:hypothetical protein
VAVPAMPASSYTLTFGKHRGKTLIEAPKSYVTWLVAEGLHETRSDLHTALVGIGRLPPSSQQSGSGSGGSSTSAGASGGAKVTGKKRGRNIGVSGRSLQSLRQEEEAEAIASAAAARSRNAGDTRGGHREFDRKVGSKALSRKSGVVGFGDIRKEMSARTKGGGKGGQGKRWAYDGAGVGGRKGGSSRGGKGGKGVKGHGGRMPSSGGYTLGGGGGGGGNIR